MICQNNEQSALLERALAHLKPQSTILDLACGNGRNGLYLAGLGHNVTYLDRNEQSLIDIVKQDKNAKCITADLETTPVYQLPVAQFDAIIVFRYLHRPLFPSIVNALKPGGVIVYETFNHQQAAIGRPKNPNFLLQNNELSTLLSGFKPLYQFDGFDEQQQAYISQFIGRN
ncbi:class I SAM-dependent methyltransferase [Psychrobium sp. nBUS_13]|uniref:class I SAM-dependent methyltransferase n=1 Tax=Psychrobium sp. nBUS_13 TaxID=3395319 RepID=UPI003EB6CC87